MQAIDTRLIDIVRAAFELEADAVITLDSHLGELGDSLDWVNLLGAVEAAFDLHIDLDESLALDTVGDLVRLVQACTLVAEEAALD